ncbi:hypothetical protein [Methylobacter sp.]|uniref:hypothetical protein n=1 Tax=Methylobacter sp. TaxID=2051955 RepID=UPI003DA507EE
MLQFVYIKLIGFIRVGIIVSTMGCSSVNAAEIVVNQTVPSKQYTLADIRAVFMMRQRFWPNGEQIKVFTLSDSDLLHKDFVKNNLNMFPHQLRRIWDRMLFSGTGAIPVQLDSEQEMIDKIANTPYAIGYLNNRPDNEKIRLFEYQ